MCQREKYYTYPATQGSFRCFQDIPWQLPEDGTARINTRKTLLQLGQYAQHFHLKVPEDVKAVSA